MSTTRTDMNGKELDPARKDERNVIRKTLREGCPNDVFAEVKKLKRSNKAKLEIYLSDLFDVLSSQAYWIYEEACDYGGFCG